MISSRWLHVFIYYNRFLLFIQNDIKIYGKTMYVTWDDISSIFKENIHVLLLSMVFHVSWSVIV